MKTPRSLRLHIGIFGRRNAGKSTLINALAGKEIAIVSDVAGTTTDPIFFDAEIGNVPVTFIDTAGIDDIGELGRLRIERTLDVLSKVDVALLVVDATKGFGDYERNLVKLFEENKIKFIIVINKIDLADYESEEIKRFRHVKIGAKDGINIDRLIDMILRISPDIDDSQFLDDLIEPKDLVVLNIPIDLGAPKGRLIYPQVQAIRNILDKGASCIVVKERELKWALDGLKKKPKMVITDSHAFTRASADTPKDIPLTSFSILEARFKTGNLPELIRGVLEIKKLKPGDRVLVAEACTHHPSPDDIGRVKIPRWIRNIAGDVKFDHVMGGNFPSDLSKYRLIIHCGACTLTRRHMRYRLKKALDNGVPMTNYGLVIAFVHGILPRAIEMFPDAMKVWKEYFGDYERNS
jgi:[FeFe] hydrogenase H-cluster maturation GTPase HydF